MIIKDLWRELISKSYNDLFLVILYSLSFSLSVLFVSFLVCRHSLGFVISGCVSKQSHKAVILNSWVDDSRVGFE